MYTPYPRPFQNAHSTFDVSSATRVNSLVPGATFANGVIEAPNPLRLSIAIDQEPRISLKNRLCGDGMQIERTKGTPERQDQ